MKNYSSSMGLRWTLPLLCLAAAGACAPATVIPPMPATTAVGGTPTPIVVPSTQLMPSGQDCYYVWSSQDLPELSVELNRRLQAADPAITGGAYSYGEDCVAADGSRTFNAMETDFQIQVQVADLADQNRMGNALGAAMTVIEELPSSQLQGPRPGRADFEFAAGSGSLRLSVDIASYASKADGLQGAPLFDALRSAQ
jgi:hypothetical protein